MISLTDIFIDKLIKRLEVYLTITIHPRLDSIEQQQTDIRKQLMSIQHTLGQIRSAADDIQMRAKLNYPTREEQEKTRERLDRWVEHDKRKREREMVSSESPDLGTSE